jgi:hypothetical protein
MQLTMLFGRTIFIFAALSSAMDNNFMCCPDYFGACCGLNGDGTDTMCKYSPSRLKYLVASSISSTLNFLLKSLLFSPLSLTSCFFRIDSRVLHYYKYL